MMNTLALKIFGGTAVFGALGTTTYFGAKNLWKTSTIAEQLKSENFKFIKFDDNSQWDEEFSSDSANIKLALGEEVKTGENLRDKCKFLLESDSVKNKLSIVSVKKWCVIRKISNQIERKRKTFLVGLSGTESDLNSKWKATYDKHKSVNTNREKLGLKEQWPSVESDALAELKNACQINANSDFLASNKELYTVVENLCTVEGAKA